ncbi:hypothetical protein CSW53_18115 [Rhodococcus ruber]|nr:hypothetical protein CSW53_18115 [Rhodococcus ruber]
MLAMRAGELLKGGTPDTDVRAALELWLTKPNLGPGVLPSLVSEVIRNRSQPAAAAPGTALAPTGTAGGPGRRPGIGKPTSKALGYMNAAQELANAMINEGTTR